MMSAQVGQQIKTKDKDEGSSDGEEYKQKRTENAPARENANKRKLRRNVH